MSHSNSSLNTFTSCMKKYELSYIQGIRPDKVSPHLTFGTMAHDVLYKIGTLRDEQRDGIQSDITSIIPSELLYEDLKDYFKIPNWYNYFVPVIKQVTKYETDICDKFVKDYGEYEIYRELKLQLTVDDLAKLGYRTLEPIVGVIDLLIVAPGKGAVILDYKFSSSRKTQDDFDMNSQLPLYSLFVSKLYKVPTREIQYGYIDIPKMSFETPTILSNGTLSRAKSQNCSAEMYEAAVQAIHGDDPYYNCSPGGYYEDCYFNLKNNKAAYLSLQYLDEDTYKNVVNDLLETAELIDTMKAAQLPFCRKFDAYTCKSCDMIRYCKPWLGVEEK